MTGVKLSTLVREDILTYLSKVKLYCKFFYKGVPELTSRYDIML